jgi:hypothetical protein
MVRIVVVIHGTCNAVDRTSSEVSRKNYFQKEIQMLQMMMMTTMMLIYKTAD